jgi:hypothetical protein
MKVTDRTRRVLAHRRAIRRLEADGYEEVNSHGGRLWELDRGWRQKYEITDVVIGPNRKTLWVKVEKMGEWP